MRRWLILAVLMAGCGKKDPAPPSAPPPEPDRVKVRHILVSWSGADRSKSTLSRAAAEKKAERLFERAKGGDDFERMMKEESEDPGAGVYTLVNKGVTPERGENSRDGMVKGFSDASFRLQVKQCALVPYDSKTSPFGWHIIQRVE